MRYLLILLFISLLQIRCTPISIKQEKHLEEETDSLVEEEEKSKDSLHPQQPLWGYRFTITGDFNGDGKQDTLHERFVDLETRKETNKFFEDLPLIDHQTYDYKYRKVAPFLNPIPQRLTPSFS